MKSEMQKTTLSHKPSNKHFLMNTACWPKERICHTQANFFNFDQCSTRTNFYVVMDDSYAECLPYYTRFPMILPRGHWVTTLIVKHYHEKGYHASGTNQTLADLSSRFWIIAAREKIRAWEKNCTECRKRKAKPASQVMAPLPRTRVKEPLRAFSKIADFHHTRKRES